MAHAGCEIFHYYLSHQITSNTFLTTIAQYRLHKSVIFGATQVLNVKVFKFVTLRTMFLKLQHNSERNISPVVFENSSVLADVQKLSAAPRKRKPNVLMLEVSKKASINVFV